MHPHGWRLSVGLAIVPALILFLGSLLLPDTPNSLAHRGHTKKARQVSCQWCVGPYCILVVCLSPICSTTCIPSALAWKDRGPLQLP